MRSYCIDDVQNLMKITLGKRNMNKNVNPHINMMKICNRRIFGPIRKKLFLFI